MPDNNIPETITTFRDIFDSMTMAASLSIDYTAKTFPHIALEHETGTREYAEDKNAYHACVVAIGACAFI